MELELIQMFGKEGVSIVTIIVVYMLFVKPKDTQIKNLVDNNRKAIDDNTQQLSIMTKTMEKISTELTRLTNTQHQLKDGQENLWREVRRLKGEDE